MEEPEPEPTDPVGPTTTTIADNEPPVEPTPPLDQADPDEVRPIDQAEKPIGADGDEDDDDEDDDE